VEEGVGSRTQRKGTLLLRNRERAQRLLRSWRNLVVGDEEEVLASVVSLS
jgi:hypothetical protein